MEKFEIAGKTDVGMTRQVNEDSMVSFESRNGTVIAVCDGMGGQAAGEVASQLACTVIRDILTNNDFANPLDAITAAITAANRGILHRTTIKPEYAGMGATCVMLLIRGGKVYYGWVGDSRIYYISGNTITQLSKDQSYVQTLVDSGQISQAEAETHPQRNEITNALGMANMTPPQLCTVPVTPEPGSMFLLCSDGLSGMVDAMHMEQICSAPGMTLQQKADALVNAANAAGGYDNITVQLVQFGAGAAAPRGAAAPPTPGENTGTRKSKAVVEGEKRKRTIIYACAAVVLLAVAIFFIVRLLGDEKKEQPQPVPAPTEDVRHHDQTPSPAPVQNVTVPQQKESAPAPKNTGSKSSSQKSSTQSVIKQNQKEQAKKDAIKVVNNPKTEPKKQDNAGKGSKRNEGDEL